MNVQTVIDRPRPVKFKAADFWLLRHAHRFAGYSKSELIDGELLGVLRQADDEPESDAIVPIRLTIADYELLDQVGTFAKYTKTELIHGVVYALSPQHRPHGFIKDELAYRLRRTLETLGSQWQVATEQSVVLEPYSQPQPDIILTTEPRGEGPIPGSTVGLLVEVSASTVNFDLQDKQRLYARVGVPEYWVVDVTAAVLHQFWSATSGGYVEHREVRLGESTEAVTIAHLTVDTDGLLQRANTTGPGSGPG